jgi:cytochrome c-type biogenesis protein CcmF
VHSFASDPKRGLYILLLLACTIGIALFIFILRAKHFVHYKYFALLSKESTILVNNLLLVVLSLTILLGIAYPFVLEYTRGVKVTIGAPYYNKIFGIAALPTLFLAAISPGVSWRKEKFKNLLKKFKFSAAGSIVLGLILYPNIDLISWVSLVLSSFVLFVTAEIICTAKLKNLANLSAAALGHSGIVIMIIGIITCTTWHQEKEIKLSTGDTTKIAGFSVLLQKISTGKANNYLFLRGKFNLENKVVLPEIRYYPVEDVKISDTAIFRKFMSDLYFVIESAESMDSILVKIQYRPLINLIWLGCFMIFLSGIAAIFRLRITRG